MLRVESDKKRELTVDGNKMEVFVALHKVVSEERWIGRRQEDNRK